MSSNIISQTRLKELLHYDPETGVFTWKVKRGPRSSGAQAGTLKEGYIRIGIDVTDHYAHRLAFLHVYGYLPRYVDHKNQNKSDNRIENLREVSNALNARNSRKWGNNTSGCTGVGWHKHGQTWRAYMQVDGRFIHLGYFTDYFEACAARKSANNHYGFTARHGSG